MTRTDRDLRRSSPAGSAAATLLASALAVALAACGAGDRAPSGAWAGTIDTLAGGIVHVQNPETGIWGPDDAWRIEEELRIGVPDGAGPELFGEIADLAVDDYGRIYVLEGQAQEIRVFDPDGRHIRTFGRPGSGPGEFKQAGAIRWGPDGRLWVVDFGNARYAVFDTTGEYVTMARRTSGLQATPWPGTIDETGRVIDLVVAAYGPPTASLFSPPLVRFRIDSQDPVPEDTIRLPPYEPATFETGGEGSFSIAVVPFTPHLTWFLDPRGHLWTGLPDRYRVVQHTLAGDTLRIIDRSYRPVPVTAAERAERIEGLKWFTDQGGRIDASRIPSTKPAYQTFFVDPDGYLWVRPQTAEGEESRSHDVFDPEGRYLGVVESDFVIASFRPLVIGDRLYAITRDEFDIPYVVRARIVRPAAASESGPGS